MKKNIAIAIAIAYALGALLFPERFLTFNATWVDYTDSMLSYAGAFYLTNGLFHGGLQLWDRFDQMPITFFAMNFGMYKLTNLLTALSYAVLSPLSHWPAHFFHTLFSFIFIFVTLCVRATGVYLLLSLFVPGRWVLIAGTVYGSLVLCPQFMMGLSTNVIYSLFPLMLYCLLRFFEELKSGHLFLFAVIWIYCIATDVFCGAGYLYQALHFVLVPGVAWMFWQKRASIKLQWQKSHTTKLITLFMLALVLLAPTLYLLKFNYHDYEFGMDNSRMKDPLSVTAYFKRPAAWAPQAEFFRRTLDFTENQWALNWIYLGFGAVFFTIFGVLSIRDKRKWILCAAAVLFFLINSPRDAGWLSGGAHWLNALTNPLKFLPRSYHMSCAMLLPFVLLPLIAGGFAQFWQYAAGDKSKENRGELYLRGALFLTFVVGAFALPVLPAAARTLFVAQTVMVVLMWLALALFRQGPVRKKAALAAVLALFAMDAWGMSHYVRGLLDDHLTSPRPVLARPDVGLVNMDEQNPKLLPVRRYYALKPYRDDDTYLFEAAASMPGLVFSYTNHLRYYQPISNYLPRHKAFKDWAGDGGVMMYYLKDDPRLVFMARAAVEDKDDNFRQILVRGLQRDVAVVDGQGSSLASVAGMAASSAPAPAMRSMVVPWSDVRFEDHNGLRIGTFASPQDLPAYASTTFLTPDEQLFGLSVGEAVFHPAQGNLVVPMTFDVNNVRERAVSFSLPRDFQPIGDGVRLTYPVRPAEGLTDVFKNGMDDFGFVYKSSYDGWLVIHQPFDPKWEIQIDGKTTPFYKTNKSFIGLPLSKGEHKILLRYWPHTPVRWLLALFIMASNACLIWIFYAATKRTI